MRPTPNRIICGHNLLVLKSWPDACVDSVVTDPPYGLHFMGKKWDTDVPKVAIWREVLRVLKPGGHLLSFFGTRTYHRGVVAIEDAGFEIRDQLGWMHSQGFPKGIDVSKAIDKEAGRVRAREKCGGLGTARSFADDRWTQENMGQRIVDTPITESARRWKGWNVALKPAWEPIVLARKPLAEGTVAANVQQYGTGGINVDGCRVSLVGIQGHWAKYDPSGKIGFGKSEGQRSGPAYNRLGRWPSNLIHDGSPEVLGLFPATKSGKMKAGTKRANREGWAGPMPEETGQETIGDSGSAARFFYCAKASRAERDAGCKEAEGGHNTGPCVKPLSLMRYLCRLVTPPGGLVLDPFCGSGSTLVAAMQEGFQYLGIDKDPHSVEIARARLAYWTKRRTKA
jgi:SAM-dependent methyltransferase